MARNQASVFFKIQSETMNEKEMDQFARELILNVDQKAIIKTTKSDNNEICYCVTSNNRSLSEKIIHEFNYTQFDNCKTLAMWNNQTPKYEILIEGAPEDTTRRDYFLLMEKFGPIGRVSPSGSKPGCAWVAFLYPNSAKEAVASREMIGDNVLNITEVNDNQKLNKWKKNGRKNVLPRTNSISY